MLKRYTACLALLWLLGVGIPRPAEGRSQDPSACAPSTCEIVLTRQATVSDEATELHGAFGSAHSYAEQDERGRLYFAVRHGIAVFDSAGRFVTRIGGRGEGPGEFIAPSPPLIGPGDSIHVFDRSRRRLSVFSPDLDLARTATGLLGPTGWRPGIIRDDGLYVVADQIRTPDRIGLPLHLMSEEGEVTLSFGSGVAEYRPDLPLVTDRVVALAGDGTVWAAAPGRYVLERWDPNTGRHLETIRIEASWFEESVRPTGNWQLPPVPTISGLWQSEEGILWVLAHVASTDWSQPSHTGEFAPTASDRADRYDSIVQAIDPETEEVLATRRIDRPLWVHPQSKLLTSFNTSNPLFVAFDVWTTHLQPRENSP